MAGLIGQAVYAQENMLCGDPIAKGEKLLEEETIGEKMRDLIEWIITKRYVHDGIFVFENLIVEIYEHTSWGNTTSVLITFWLNTAPALFVIFSGDGHVRHVGRGMPDRAIGA